MLAITISDLEAPITMEKLGLVQGEWSDTGKIFYISRVIRGEIGAVVTSERILLMDARPEDYTRLMITLLRHQKETLDLYAQHYDEIYEYIHSRKENV